MYFQMVLNVTYTYAVPYLYYAGLMYRKSNVLFNFFFPSDGRRWIKRKNYLSTTTSQRDSFKRCTFLKMNFVNFA